MTPPPELRLVVAVPTFRRPATLAGLLARLPERLAEVEGARVEVLVLDNDPAGSARQVVRDAPLPVRYVVEARPGIAAVRDRALDETADADLLAFLDDDERPRERWLAALVDTWRDTGRPAAVMGRVISVFAHEPDPWLLATGVFRRRPRPTGIEIPVAASGNLLLDLRQVRSLGTRFDVTLGLAGGEDTLFSRALVDAGGRIVWCNESEAEDLVPAERMTRAWAMRRAFNGGNGAVQVELRLARGPARRALVRARALVGGTGRTVAGAARHVWGRWTGDLESDARGLRTSHRGRGMVAGAFGHLHRQYARDGATPQGARPASSATGSNDETAAGISA